jgi:tRNA threonylcarbamoyladenosine biosynthesis protein TsaB
LQRGVMFLPPMSSVKILALEASTEACSVALLNDAGVTVRSCAIPKSHAKTLLPMIDDVLHEASVTLADLTAIAVSRGPGSFTGIRICLSVAQGLSYGSKRPLMAFNSLEVAAQVAASQADHQVPTLLIPAFDARMNEVYWAAYLIENTIITEVASPQLHSPGDFNRAMQSLSVARKEYRVAVGHGWTLDEVDRDGIAELHPEVSPSASGILALIASRGIDNVLEAAQLDAVSNPIEPLYLRNEVTWKKRKKIRTSESLFSSGN